MLQRDSAPPTPGRAASWLDALCCWLAWLVPLALALGSPGPGARWQDDLELLRELGWISAGIEGVPSTVTTQLVGLLPVGARSARAGLVAALALAAASGLAYGSWRKLLDARRAFSLNPLLALIGSLLWALSTLLLGSVADPGSATGPGSGAVTVGLLLLGLRVISAGLARPSTLPLLGVVLGLCFAESHVAALVLLLILLADALWEGSRSELPWGYVAAGFALSAGTCLLVPWLRSWAAGSSLDWGLQALPGAADSLWAQAAVARSWREQAGRVLLSVEEQLGDAGGLLALLGLAAAVLHAPQRRALQPWGLLALAGLLAQLGGSHWGALAASLGLAAFVPVGLQHGVSWLWSRPLPFARAAGVLGLAFALTLVLQRLESLGAQPAQAPGGAEIWTEAALERLPPRSVLLVEHPALGLRLLGAQLLAGARPDVVTVPLQLLQRGALLPALLRRAPELAPVLRQVAVQGYADEAALSRLAQERPLYVELDPRWHARLLEHLQPEGLWLAFVERPPSASERRDAAEESGLVLQQLRQQLEQAGALDDATSAALSTPLRQRALLLAALGDNQLSASTLRELLVLEPHDPLALELMRRLERQQGRVALSGLLGER